MRDLWYKVIATGGTRVFTLVSGLIMLTLMSRWTGPEGRGAIGAAMGWVTLFSTFGGLSLGQVALHRATSMRGQPWLGDTLGSLLTLAGGITVAGWAVGVALYVATGGAIFGAVGGGLLLVAFLGLPFLIWEQYGSQLLIAMNRLGTYNRIQVSGRLVGVGLMFVAAWLGGGVVALLGALILSQGVIALLGLLAVLRACALPVRPSWLTIRALLRGGALLHLNTIGAFLFTSTDVLILNFYHGARVTGYYQLAVDLMLVMVVLPQAVATVLYARGAELGPEALWGAQRKVMALLLGAMVVAGGLAALAAPLLIAVVAGPAFAPSAGIFQLLLLTLVGVTLSTVMAPQWIGRGMFLQASAITVAVGLANLSANLALVPAHGVNGAVWATIGSYGIAIATNSWMIVRCERQWRQGSAHPAALSLQSAQAPAATEEAPL